MTKIGKIIGYHMVPKFWITKKVVKVGNTSGKYDILKVEGKLISLIENKTKEAFKWL